MNITEQLAEALRHVSDEARHPDYDWPLWLSKEVDEALRLYEQAKAQPVQDLPPLPIEWRKVEDADGVEVPVFRAFQMRDYARAAQAATPAPEPQWQPIETAPKDGKVLVWFSDLYGGMADVARLDDDKYAKKPRPYWSGNFERVLGILAYRNGKPTHWMPLPAAPEGQGKEAGNAD